MKKRNILIVLASILLLAGGVAVTHQELFAKGFNPKDKGENLHHMMMQLFMGSGDNPEMKQELVTYVKNNIYPAIKDERGKLEEKLTADEKETIKKARLTMATKYPDIIRMMQNMHNKKGELSDKEKENAQAMHRELMQITAPLLKISEKHRDDMKDIHNRLGAKAEEWHTGLKNVMGTWAGDEKEPGNHTDESHADAHQSLHQHFKAMHDNDHPGMGDMMAVHFLLMDPNASSMETFFHGSSLPVKEHDGNAMNGAGLKVYPNPVQNNSAIEFVVETDGNVVIDILDKEGRPVKTVLNEFRKKGTYTLNVDLGKYKEGAYYVRYINGQNVTSKTLLKN